MIIGVPKEIKNHEYRVGMVPASVRELTARNHTVFVQSGAGSGIGFSDADYLAAGAEILASAKGGKSRAGSSDFSPPSPRTTSKNRGAKLLTSAPHRDNAPRVDTDSRELGDRGEG